jgi:hypothetical protein
MICLESHENYIFPFTSSRRTRNNRSGTIEHGMRISVYVRPSLCSSQILCQRFVELILPIFCSSVINRCENQASRWATDSNRVIVN